MHSHALLVTLAGMAAADMMLPHGGPQELAAIAAALDRRATTTGTTTSFQPATTDNPHRSECVSAFSSIYRDAPPPPFDMLDYAGCGGVPSSLTAAYSSYNKDTFSWYDEHVDAIFEARTSCMDIILESASMFTTSWPCSYTGSDIATFDAFLGPSTKTTTVSSTSSATATSTPAATGGPAPTGTAAAGGADANAGYRDTGLAWAAVGVAGMLGAVALL